MALIPHEVIYRSNLASLGAFNSQFFADAAADGDIVAVYFKADSVSSFSGNWYFGLTVDGVDVLAGTDRPQITAMDLEPYKTGLSIPVSFRDRMIPTIDARGAGMVNGPISVIIVIDDHVTTDVAAAIHAATSKSTPVDADELGIWDSVSTLLRKVTWANIKTTLAVVFAPLASPAFTGTPTAPTAAAGTNTTQISTTAFVIAEILARLASNDAMLYKGAISCAANPNYPAADAGFTYRISASGKIGGAAGTTVTTGDIIICHVDSSAAGNQATVGANWDVIHIPSAIVAALDDLTDVVMSGSPAHGNALSFDGTNWANRNELGNNESKIRWDGTGFVGAGDLDGTGNGTQIQLDDVNSALDVYFGTSDFTFDGPSNTVISTAPIIIPDNAYGSGWNGSFKAATENAIYDKIEAILLSGGYSDEQAQDAIGAMIDSSLTYVDGTPLLQRAALTGDVTAAAGSNATSIAANAVTTSKILNSNVTLAKIANIANARVLGNVTGSAGPPTEMTKADLLTLLGLADAMAFRGVIDCSANPNYPAADAGDLYKVSVAGKIGGAAGPNVEVGDSLVCTVDTTASGNHATVGANWYIAQSNIDGAVTGPTAAVNNRIATFNGTSGKIIQDGGQVLPAGTILGTSDTQTVTNKRITSRIGTTASSATPTPDADAHDQFNVTALAVNAVYAAPTGTPTDGQALMLRIKDAGAAKTLGFNSIYRAVGITMPTTTVISKTIYLGCVYNAADTKWDVIGYALEA